MSADDDRVDVATLGDLSVHKLNAMSIRNRDADPTPISGDAIARAQKTTVPNALETAETLTPNIHERIDMTDNDFTPEADIRGNERDYLARLTMTPPLVELAEFSKQYFEAGCTDYAEVEAHLTMLGDPEALYDFQMLFDAAAESMLGQIKNNSSTLKAMAGAKFDSAIPALRAERRTLLPGKLNFILSVLRGDVWPNAHPLNRLLDQAYPVDAECDKTLKYWTPADLREVSLEGASDTAPHALADIIDRHGARTIGESVDVILRYEAARAKR